MRCADCGVGMGAGEKADDEFVSHSGVTGWTEAWEDGLTGSTDQSHGWHWHWTMIVIDSMQDRARRYRRYESTRGEFSKAAF